MPTAKKKRAKSSSAKTKEPKPIGAVTHFYGGIGVAIVKFNRAVATGETVHFKGAHTDFTQNLASMQYDHKDIQSAKKGQEIGIKVDDKVREGDHVFAAEK
jgi:U32 family peptidase